MLIEAQGITKTYQIGDTEVQALAGVDLAIDRGEFVAIMGPSGSGKSTLMHILGCLDSPSSGSYMLDGVEIAALDDVELARIRNSKIGFVFQSYNLLARTTALENVELPLIYSKVKEDWTEMAIAALNRVGLGDRIHHLWTAIIRSVLMLRLLGVGVPRFMAVEDSEGSQSDVRNRVSVPRTRLAEEKRRHNSSARLFGGIAASQVSGESQAAFA